MKITFKNAAGVKVSLAAGACEGPSGLSHSNSPMVQEVELPDAPQPQYFDRGNFRNAWIFSVTRKHANLITAERFILEHAAELQDAQGTITFQAEGELGTARELSMPGKVTIASQTQTGLTTHHSYRVEGGRLA